MVKPGIRKLTIKRGKKLNWERREELNLLMLLRSYLAMKLQCGERHQLEERKDVQKMILDWYQTIEEKLLLQARTDEVRMGENVRLYHHELHKKHVKKTSIL